MCNQSDKDLQTDVFAIIVLIYGVINLLIRVTELTLAIISTCFMLGPLFSGNSAAFHTFLHDETNRILWNGPYPENLTIFQTWNQTQTQENEEVYERNAAQFRINLQVWCGHLLWKTIVFIYASLLVVAARKRSYSLNLVWFSFAIPALCSSLLRFSLDLLMIDYFLRPLPNQITQPFNVFFQILGIMLDAFLLHALHIREEKIRDIDRYNSNNNNILFKRSSINGINSISNGLEQIDGITIRPLSNADDERY